MNSKLLQRILVIIGELSYLEGACKTNEAINQLASLSRYYDNSHFSTIAQELCALETMLGIFSAANPLYRNIVLPKESWFDNQEIETGKISSLVFSVMEKDHSFFSKKRHLAVSKSNEVTLI